MNFFQSCEEGMVKLKQASSNNQPGQLYYVVNQILFPLVQGCESRDVKISKVQDSYLNMFISQFNFYQLNIILNFSSV